MNAVMLEPIVCANTPSNTNTLKHIAPNAMDTMWSKQLKGVFNGCILPAMRVPILCATYNAIAIAINPINVLIIIICFIFI